MTHSHPVSSEVTLNDAFRTKLFSNNKSLQMTNLLTSFNPESSKDFYLKNEAFYFLITFLLDLCFLLNQVGTYYFYLGYHDCFNTIIVFAFVYVFYSFSSWNIFSLFFLFFTITFILHYYICNLINEFRL